MGKRTVKPSLFDAALYFYEGTSMREAAAAYGLEFRDLERYLQAVGRWKEPVLAAHWRSRPRKPPRTP